MTDLADRISRAAVAALDLAPFDDRYANLSRQVLAGGASRFSRVIANDQAVHYVIPAGLVGERVAYGALVLQDHQAGVLWRDADGLDRTAVVSRDDAMKATFSPVVLGAEEWMRFDITSESGVLSFLAPPVAGSLLDRTLIDFFRATAGARSTADVFIAVDDPETTAVQPAVVDERAPAETETPPEPEPAAESVAADPEATAVYAPFADEEPSDPEPVAADAEATQVAEVVAAVPSSPVSAEETAPLATQPFGLYRDEAPVPQPTAPPPTVPLPTAPLPTAPLPTAPPAYVLPMAGTAEVTQTPQPSMSRTTAGFLLGFFGILLIGGLAFAVRLLGS